MTMIKKSILVYSVLSILLAIFSAILKYSTHNSSCKWSKECMVSLSDKNIQELQGNYQLSQIVNLR